MVKCITFVFCPVIIISRVQSYFYTSRIMGAKLPQFLKSWPCWLLTCLKDNLGGYRGLGHLYFCQNSVSILLLPVGSECWEGGWRQTESSLFCLEILMTLYVISLVISKLLGWSADIFLSVSFLSQSMPFLSAYLSLCFNKLSFITFLNIFYIWSNLVMQIIHLLALHCRYSTSITAYVASWLPYAQLYFKLSSF